VAQQAMARQFFGRHLDAADRPGFAHRLRWDGAAPLRRLFHPDLRERLAASPNVVAELIDDLPEEFGRWSALAQDQYLETRTLLSGYLLASQGDRMLMGNSVEGRFPLLDPHVVELANSLQAGYKLRGLSEKHVLKRAGRGLVTPEVLQRQKQPYRAPDALSFVGAGAPDWLAEVLEPRALALAAIFSPAAVRALWAKLEARPDASQYSNADNMAVVGVLSTQLLHQRFVVDWSRPSALERPTVLRDCLAEAWTGAGAGGRTRR
jgi:asparagine synthase (glutamine-hydrolysing)